MSYLVTTPDLVIAAVEDLAGIPAALSAVSDGASLPTTAMAAAGADEVSAAISQLFNNFGQEFQALNAQASAFHTEFLSLLNVSAATYAGAEVINASPLAVTPAYQELFTNTAANLRAFQAVWSTDPAPLLSQVLANQQRYAQTIGAELEYTVVNFPTVVANLPADIQAAVQSVLTFDPAPYIQQFITNQTGYADIVRTSLQNAGQSFSTGLQGLPTACRTAFQDIQTGDFGGAASTLGSGFLDLVFTGFDTVVTPTVPIGVDVYLDGALGDLFPIFAIPGLEAQDFTNLLPAGSIPAQMSQNFTHVVKTLTSTTISAKVPNILPDTFKIDATLGLPFAMALQALGSPVTALSAVSTSASAFGNAIQTGDAAAALAAIVDAPAVAANGFLNGQETIPVPINIGSGLPTLQLNIPFNGILVPQSPLTTTIDWGFPYHTRTYDVGGTAFGGFIPALYGASAQLAEVIKPA